MNSSIKTQKVYCYKCPPEARDLKICRSVIAVVELLGKNKSNVFYIYNYCIYKIISSSLPTSADVCDILCHYTEVYSRVKGPSLNCGFTRMCKTQTAGRQ